MSNKVVASIDYSLALPIDLSNLDLDLASMILPYIPTYNGIFSPKIQAGDVNSSFRKVSLADCVEFEALVREYRK